jgi:hypothetical protein
LPGKITPPWSVKPDGFLFGWFKRAGFEVVDETIPTVVKLCLAIVIGDQNGEP